MMRCLHPAAFAIVMGTGTLSCVTLAQTDLFPWLSIPGKALCWLNYILFLCLAPYAIISWLKGKAEIRRHLDLPGQMAFFATIGIGLLVLANQTLLYDYSHVAALSFWIAGAGVTFCLNLAIFLRSFLKKLDLEHITPAFFIPVVGLVVIPVAGCRLAPELSGWASDLMLPICSLGLGAGLLLYAGLFGAMLERHLLLAPIPDHLAPTIWIHLAPLGWGAMAMLSLAGLAADPGTQKTIEFFCLLAWGAATWWVVMALALTARAIIRHGMYFNMAWWSFIFPLGSYALLSRRLGFWPGAELSFFVWGVMVFLWIYCAIKTLRIAFSGVCSF